MEKNDYFKLFANCIPVKGARRAIICDLQRNRFDFIPNDLFRILLECKVKPLDQVKIGMDDCDLETVNEYIDFLIQNEYGFWCNAEVANAFVDLDLSFNNPSVITNAIIDVGSDYQHDFANIFEQLDDLGCKDLQIRVYRKTTLTELSQILSLLYRSRIKTVQLVIQSVEEFNEESLIEICKRNLRVINIIISGHFENKTVKTGIDSYTNLTFTKEIIDSCQSCGVVHPAYFSVNIQHFTEALNHNTCLNRKISIDQAGFIKNCPSLKDSFGKISDTKLKNVVKTTSFKKLWGIHKDQIEECMDCEFRYICTDCRAYLSDPDNSLSKPSKCKYDPYNAKWGSN